MQIKETVVTCSGITVVSYELIKIFLFLKVACNKGCKYTVNFMYEMHGMSRVTHEMSLINERERSS